MHRKLHIQMMIGVFFLIFLGFTLRVELIFFLQPRLLENDRS